MVSFVLLYIMPFYIAFCGRSQGVSRNGTESREVAT